MGAPGHPADQILVRGLKQGRYGKVYGRVEAGLNVILEGGEKRCSTAAPWAGGPILAVGPEVLRRRFWAQPLKSAFSPDLNPICLLSSNKELRTPFPLHGPFNSIERCRRQAPSTGQGSPSAGES